MSALTVSVLVLATFSPVLAPVPPEPPPDPFAKGYLGIYFGGTGPNASLVIDRVVPNEGAAKAGLRSGDVIVRVNHLQPQNTEQVINHVCTFRPGASIEVEVQRGTERKAFKVKLGTRPPDAGRTAYPVLPSDE
jgi:S1-C subfamily serine protease